MKENILKAVAQPPMLLGAPMLPAFICLSVHILAIFIFAVTFMGKFIPYALFSLIITHSFVFICGKREPHLSNILRCFFKTPRGSNNILKEKGDKFIP